MIQVYQVTYNATVGNGNVPALADRRLYEAMLVNSTGVVTGVTISATGTSLIVTSGWGIIRGAAFEVQQETIAASVPSSGTQQGRLLIELNVVNNTIEFHTQVGTTLPSLVQEDINNGGSVYQMELATYSISATAISNLSTTYQTITTGAALSSLVDGINARLGVAESKLSGVETGAQVNTVTGVKGSSESSYRTGNVNLTAANVGAVPTSRTVNGKALSSNISLSASDVSAVPTTRTVNGKELSRNINITKSDVGLGKVNNNAIAMSLSGTTLTITYS